MGCKAGIPRFQFVGPISEFSFEGLWEGALETVGGGDFLKSVI